jgi:large subunit ribosomal protein L19
MSHPLADIEAKASDRKLPPFSVGDQVAVAVLIREAATKGSKDKRDKERVQQFIGDVIAIKGRGLGRSFTVRRIVEGEGVERSFPFHSPLVTDVKVRRRGKVRRAKLYDLRGKSGKAARIKERAFHSDHAARKKPASPTPPPKAAEATPAASGAES